MIVGMLAGCDGSQTQAATMPQFAARQVLMATGSGCGSQCCPALPGGTGILPDGDFSQAPNPGDHTLFNTKGQVFAPYWEVSKKNVNFTGTAYWDVDGLCSVDLDGLVPGAITTSAFPTKKGAAYTLAFVLSGNGGGPPTVKTMKVTVGNQFTAFSWDTSGGNDAQNGDYAPETWTFRATKPLSVLTFTSEEHPKGGGYGAVIAGMAIKKN
jgi:hypothetical protein